MPLAFDAGVSGSVNISGCYSSSHGWRLASFCNRCGCGGLGKGMGISTAIGTAQRLSDFGGDSYSVQGDGPLSIGSVSYWPGGAKQLSIGVDPTDIFAPTIGYAACKCWGEQIL